MTVIVKTFLFQLRKIFHTPEHKKTRLWISEKALVPRFRQLLLRFRMLNDCIHRDKIYILALEVKSTYWHLRQFMNHFKSAGYWQLLRIPRLVSARYCQKKISHTYRAGFCWITKLTIFFRKIIVHILHSTGTMYLYSCRSQEEKDP